MSEWIDRIKNHAISATIEAVHTSLVVLRGISTSDVDTANSLSRVDRIINFGKNYLDQIDPELTPLLVLDEANQFANSAMSELNNFTSNQNATHLQNANLFLDSFLKSIGGIPRLDADATRKEAFEAFNTQKQSISGQISGLRKELSNLTIEKNSVSEKLLDLSNEIKQNKQRTDSIISEFQNQFSLAQESRQTDFASSSKTKAEEWTNFVNNYSVKCDEVIYKHEKNVADALREIEIEKIYAQKIVGIISTEAVTHGYGKTANEEKSNARTWSIVAAGSLVVWILAGLIFFYLTYDEDLSWTALARQFLISAPFILLAGFSALQVGKHQKVERISRQQELELAAIDPYLATFSSEEKNEIKRELAEKMFGQRDIEPTKTELKLSIETLTDAAKSIKEMKDAVLKK